MARLACLLAIASLATVAQAHNYVLKPRAPFKSGISGMGNWVDEFKPPFSGDVSNGKSFMALAKQNNVANVRSFIENRGPDCGNTDPNAKAQAIPSDKKVQLYRSMDHPGPCELWIDSTMVYHNDDCQAAFGSATPNIPVDFSSCKGNCMLRFYWLGLQDKGQRMQSYKNCIPLTGGGGGGGGGEAQNGGGGNGGGGNGAKTTGTGGGRKSTGGGTTGGGTAARGTGGRNGARSMDDAELNASYGFDDLELNATDYRL